MHLILMLASSPSGLRQSHSCSYPPRISVFSGRLSLSLSASPGGLPRNGTRQPHHVLPLSAHYDHRHQTHRREGAIAVVASSLVSLAHEMLLTPQTQLLQDPDRPRGHRRAQERHPDPRHAQERRPVPQHQAGRHQRRRRSEVPAPRRFPLPPSLPLSLPLFFSPVKVPRREERVCVCVDARKQKANTRTQSAVKNVFIRGSVVRYVHLPANAVDVPLLEDATRRGKSPFLAIESRSPCAVVEEQERVFSTCYDPC